MKLKELEAGTYFEYGGEVFVRTPQEHEFNNTGSQIIVFSIDEQYTHFMKVDTEVAPLKNQPVEVPLIGIDFGDKFEFNGIRFIKTTRMNNQFQVLCVAQSGVSDYLKLDRMVKPVKKVRYQGRDYCRAVECGNQLRLDDAICEHSEETKERIKKYCREQCGAYKFHEYLEKEGYPLEKEVVDE